MVLAIVQARLGSRRFPRKMLAPLRKKPVLAWVLSRLAKCRSLDRIVVATTTSKVDDELATWLKREGVALYRGSEKDVLDRFYRAATQAKAETIVRITGDCPLVMPDLVDRLVQDFSKARVDYLSNTLQATFPDGLDVEVFSMTALRRAWREARDPSDREHVTRFFHRRPGFKTRNVYADGGNDWSHLNWTVDYPEDLRELEKVYQKLGSAGLRLGWAEVRKRLGPEKNPEAWDTRKISNEGYYHSLLQEKRRVATRKPRLASSLAWRKRAEKVIPGATQTFSKMPNQYVQGVAPVFLERGRGSRVWDVDGNEYLDYVSALLPVVLGYRDPDVDEAARKQLAKGVSFSLPTTLEAELAEQLCEVIPSAEMVRFGKNGSDVTAGAVRAARAFTGRDVIACCGYHGWQDWFIGTTTRNRGVPKAVADLTKPFVYNDLASLEKIFTQNPNRVAGVILEPMSVTEPQPGFLEGVQQLCRKNGALLIFDEIITGFRFAIGGAQQYFGVTPDLSCFGKAMANGFPLSAVVGRRDVMKIFEEVFFSFTFGGETLSLAAALATLRKLRSEPVIPFLWAQGRKLQDGLTVFVRELNLERFIRCVGKPCWSVVTFQTQTGKAWPELKSLFQQEVIRRGVLFANGHNITYSHSNADIEHTLRVYRDTLRVLKSAVDHGQVDARLEGPPIQPVFKIRNI